MDNQRLAVSRSSQGSKGVGTMVSKLLTTNCSSLFCREIEETHAIGAIEEEGRVMDQVSKRAVDELEYFIGPSNTAKGSFCRNTTTVGGGATEKMRSMPKRVIYTLSQLERRRRMQKRFISQLFLILVEYIPSCYNILN